MSEKSVDKQEDLPPRADEQVLQDQPEANVTARPPDAPATNPVTLAVTSEPIHHLDKISLGFVLLLILAVCFISVVAFLGDKTANKSSRAEATCAHDSCSKLPSSKLPEKIKVDNPVMAFGEAAIYKDMSVKVAGAILNPQTTGDEPDPDMMYIEVDITMANVGNDEVIIGADEFAYMTTDDQKIPVMPLDNGYDNPTKKVTLVDRNRLVQSRFGVTTGHSSALLFHVPKNDGGNGKLVWQPVATRADPRPRQTLFVLEAVVSNAPGLKALPKDTTTCEYRWAANGKTPETGQAALGTPVSDGATTVTVLETILNPATVGDQPDPGTQYLEIDISITGKSPNPPLFFYWPSAYPDCSIKAVGTVDSPGGYFNPLNGDIVKTPKTVTVPGKTSVRSDPSKGGEKYLIIEIKAGDKGHLSWTDSRNKSHNFALYK